MPATSVLHRAAVELFGDDSNLVRDLSRAESRVKATGERMSRIGGIMTAAVSVPLLGIGAASVKLASDAEEFAAKFDVVMGDAADRARAKIQKLTETIPATSAELEKMASGIQDMLVPMGLVRSEAAGMSVEMVELAGDIASFNNVLPTEALMAVQSALAGESEPMRRFGVDTRVTRLEQIALEEGIIGVGDALDNTTRAYAVMAAIQRDSRDAMGDAERTVDSTANTLKFAQREIKDLGIAIGQRLNPIITPMVRGFTDVLGVFQDLSPGTQEFIVRIGGLLAAVGPLLLVGGKAITMLSVLNTKLVKLTTTAGGLTVLLGAVAVAIQGIQSAANAAEQSIEDSTDAIIGADEQTNRLNRQITDLNRTNHEAWLMWKQLKDELVAGGYEWEVASRVAFRKVQEYLEETGQTAGQMGEDFQQALELTGDEIEDLQNRYEQLRRSVMTPEETLASTLDELEVMRTELAAIGVTGGMVEEVFRRLEEQAHLEFKGARGAADRDIKPLSKKLQEATGAARDLSQAVNDALHPEVDAKDLKAGITDIRSEFERLRQSVLLPEERTQETLDYLDTLRTKLASIGFEGEDVDEIFQRLAEKAQERTEGSFEDAGKASGRALIEGIAKGVKGKDIWDRILNIFEQGLLKSIYKLLGIASPSKVFEGVGEKMMLGLEKGISQNIDSATSALGRVVPSGAESGSPALSAPSAYGQGIAVDIQLPITVSAIDGRDAMQVIESQKGTIERMVHEAVNDALGHPLRGN